MKGYRVYLTYIALLIGIFSTGLLFYMNLLAIRGGGSVLMVHFNILGEMYIEIVMYGLQCILCFIVFYWIYKGVEIDE